jgi:hypothetical protein
MNRNANEAAGRALFFFTLKGAAGPGIGPAACRPGGEEGPGVQIGVA